MSLTFHPPIPFALSLALGLAVLGLWLCLGRNSQIKMVWPSFAIRVLAVLLALLALAGPSKETPQAPAVGKPKLVVLVDASLSMAVDGRFDKAVQIAAAAQKTCAPLADVRVEDLGGHPLAAGAKPDAPQTDLVAALRNARGADAILLVSDGRATSLPGGDWLSSLKSELGGAPVYAVPAGVQNENQAAPLRLDAWADAAVAYPRQMVGFTAQVSGRPGEQVALAGGDLWARTLVIPPCGVASVSLALPVPVGAVGRWALRITAQGGAQKAEAQVAVQIAPGPARVLLLEGAPCAHTRGIARALAEDPCAALVAVYDLGPRRLITRSGAPAVEMPIPQAMDGATLAAFDVVVLGARTEAFFPDASSRQALAQFSRRGGILFARGGENSWPASLLAGVHEVAREESVRLGESHPERWRQTVAKLAHGGQALAIEERLKKAKPADPETAARVRELADTRPDPALLQAVCDATGGRMNDVGALAEELTRLRPAPAGQAQPEPAFNRPWLLAAFIGLLSLDFLLRRKRGQA